MSLSFIKEQLKKRPIQQVPALCGEAAQSAKVNSKWVKLNEFEKERQRQYMEEERKRMETQREKLEKTSNQEQLNRSGPSKQNAKKDAVQQTTLPILPPDEVVRRLRARGEPITYFDESDMQRAERLRKLELMKVMEYDDSKETDWNRIIREREKDEEETETAKLKTQNDDPVFQIEDRQPNNAKEEVLFWCRKALHEWQTRLENRSDVEKKTAQGKLESTRFKQTQNYIRPFFLQLAGKGVEPLQDDIFDFTFEIYQACQVRDYRKANDAYYRLAIGNAPWPMGVTMVGIHERSAREKISTASVAHVLNDETQRKYISAIKRVITFLQSAYVTLPSRSVM